MMKHSLFVLCCFLSLSLSAQISFTTVPAHVDTTLDFNVEAVKAVSYANITNTSNERIGLRWAQRMISSPSSVWRSAICDKNKCYIYGGRTNNDIIDDSPSDTLWLDPGESSILNVHLRPEGAAGMGTVRVRVFHIDDEEETTPYAEGIYDFTINALPVSITELEKNSIEVFPNPVANTFTLKNAPSIRILSLHNASGQQIRQFQAMEGREYDLTDLPNGVYLLEMRSQDNEFVKSVKLLKKAL